MTTGIVPRDVAAARSTIEAADGVIVVSPVFGGSYWGLFKLFVDALEPGTFDGKPVLIAATAGTPRHSLMLEHAMRPLFAFHRAIVVPTAVFAATEDFGGAAGSGLTERTSRAAGEFANLVVAAPSAVDGFAADPADRSAIEGTMRMLGLSCSPVPDCARRSTDDAVSIVRASLDSEIAQTSHVAAVAECFRQRIADLNDQSSYSRIDATRQVGPALHSLSLEPEASSSTWAGDISPPPNSNSADFWPM